MSRSFYYDDPWGHHVFTEEDIKATYFPYWYKRMEQANKHTQINWENCLDDWIVTNWATEIK